MKIIYSAGNRIGANNILSQFLENNNEHEIKIAAYGISSYSIGLVDWFLDSIHIREFYNCPLYSIKYNLDHISSILSDVIEFGPELIISDSESLFGYIAHELGIKLWYCSPLNLINGVDWNKERLRYSYIFNQYKNIVFPKADKYLIYSPFCDILNSPKLNENYEWVRPYYNNSYNVIIEDNTRRVELNKILKYVKLNDYSFTDGCTDSISNLFYNSKKIIISPHVKNNEALINSVLIDKYKIGYNVGQIELMEMKAIEELNKICNKKYNDIEFNNTQHLQLHEYIEKLKI